MWYCLNRVRTPEAQLALDEALLEDVEQSRTPVEWMRCWHVTEPVVILGRSGKRHREVDVERCRRDSVRVLRRGTGGGAVVLMPGCTVYSLALSLELRPFLRHIPQAHSWVLERIRSALRHCGWNTSQGGISDLVWQSRKCSGNSMKLTSRALLYHGTLLHHATPELLERYLTHPPREPDYRQGRRHGDFVTNVAVDPRQFCRELRRVLGAIPSATLPSQAVEGWLRRRYGQAEWHATGSLKPVPTDAAKPTPHSTRR